MLATFLSVVRDSGINISLWGVIVGLLIAALVFVIAEWVLGLIGFGPRARAVAAILAILVFIGYAFG